MLAKRIQELRKKLEEHQEQVELLSNLVYEAFSQAAFC